ncbi:hypothetical protein AOZ06_04640 [Kibdelosporangium phytohabitans]|uniref:Uncharacterized protein n=1 Tax=Kibdelosporangium phytohabitans TaxID=860235 RepID=A0A0N9HW10_9PSEU|nr:hypothetical protein AOZ06_04640 [Kibdelosporangium phytohabitans]
MPNRQQSIGETMSQREADPDDQPCGQVVNRMIGEGPVALLQGMRIARRCCGGLGVEHFTVRPWQPTNVIGDLFELRTYGLPFPDHHVDASVPIVGQCGESAIAGADCEQCTSLGSHPLRVSEQSVFRSVRSRRYPKGCDTQPGECRCCVVVLGVVSRVCGHGMMAWFSGV